MLIKHFEGEPKSKSKHYDAVTKMMAHDDLVEYEKERGY